MCASNLSFFDFLPRRDCATTFISSGGRLAGATRFSRRSAEPGARPSRGRTAHWCDDRHQLPQIVSRHGANCDHAEGSILRIVDSRRLPLNDAFQSDLSRLDEVEKAAFARAHSDATYGYGDFKRDVLQVLVDKYGTSVQAGDKAIAFAASGNRRKADVIAAIQYRRYYKFNGILDQSYEEGICFWNAKGEKIANYPKQHSSNLTTKHQATTSWLKPMVRILKNLRSRCVDDKLLASGVAPSYYLEGLLYNVPSDKFGTSYAQSFVNAINWIQSEADKDKLVCANEQYYLLRDDAHTCWPKANAEAFLSAATNLWNNW